MNSGSSASLDLRHAATDHASFVVVGPRRFFAIDGLGPPTSAEFRYALEPLRSIAERVRSSVLARLPAESRDRVPAAVPECLWWHRDLAAPDDLVRGVDDRHAWDWRQLVEIPLPSTETDAADAIDAVSRSAGRAAPLVRIVELTEGRAAQMLHVGGSATIGSTLARLYGAISAQGETPGRTIHELRTADERLVPVERAHLILRVPLEPVSTR